MLRQGVKIPLDEVAVGDKIMFRGMSDQYRLRLFPFSPEGDYGRGKEKPHPGKHSAEVYAEACIQFLEDQAASEKPPAKTAMRRNNACSVAVSWS